MEKIFGEISKQLNEESTLREEIKSVLHEMTATLRSASAYMQQIHGSIKNGNYWEQIWTLTKSNDLKISEFFFIYNKLVMCPTDF